MLTPFRVDTVPDQIWKRIYNAFLYGDVLVTAGTGRMSSRQERELGLEGQHSYVVLGMKETDHAGKAHAHLPLLNSTLLPLVAIQGIALNLTIAIASLRKIGHTLQHSGSVLSKSYSTLRACI
jgi:hypothetical protein